MTGNGGEELAVVIDRLSRVMLIQDGERSPAYYFLAIFLILGWGAAIGRGTADALFLKRYGVDFLPLMFTLLSPLLMLMSLAYAAVADRVAAERLFQRIFLALVAALLLCWLAMRSGTHELVYPTYYLLNELASEVLMVHAALYLSQNFDVQQAKRLTAPIMAGTQIGSIAGGLTLVQFSGSFGVGNLPLLWVASLLMVAVLMRAWHRFKGPSVFFRSGLRHGSGLAEAAAEVMRGLRLMRHSRLLASASLALFFMVVAFYSLGFAVQRVYDGSFAGEAELSAFYGQLGAATGTLALLLQLFVTGRMIRRYGVRTVNLYFPLSLVVVYGGLLLSLSLPLAVLASFSRSTVMPAFRNPVRNMFFNVLPENVQGRARAISLIFVMPLALLFAGLFLWLVAYLEQPRLVLLLGVSAALVYLFYNRRMNGAYLAEIVDNLRSRLHLPGRSLPGAGDLELNQALLRRMADGVAHSDEQVSIGFAELLLDVAPEQGIPLVIARLATSSAATRDRLVNRIGDMEPHALREFLACRLLDDPDAHARATALRWLCRLRDGRATGRLSGLLADPNPRLRAAAVRGVLETGQEDLCDAALAVWRDLLGDSRPEALLAGLEMVDVAVTGQVAERLAAMQATAAQRLLDSGRRRAMLRVLAALPQLRAVDADTCRSWLRAALADEHADVRLAAVAYLQRAAAGWAGRLLSSAVGDGHPLVREAAVQAYYKEDAERLAVALGEEHRLTPHQRLTLVQHLVGIRPQHPALQRLARNWVEHAHALAGVSRALADHLPRAATGGLLGALLEERRRDLVDLALTATSPRAGHEEVAVIRAALASGDRRHIASAREVLQNFADRALANRLDALLAREEPDTPVAPRTAWQTLEALAESSDAWFRACVDRVRPELAPV